MYRVAMWDKFSRPSVLQKYSLGLDTQWIDQEKAERLPEKWRQEEYSVIPVIIENA
ncbi:ABC transporter substrate-binding protein [Vibrio cholerae]|nr:ABC transporter substrate-binding protein [Vibrio cholerae]EGR4281087.1 ABC transporter substrate-binding protein [Vibrio cholerae]